MINEVNPCHVDDTLPSANRILDVTLMNHFLRNSVTVTLQWPREAGAVYHVNVSPFTEFTNNSTNHDSVVINLTISYNIQYNVSVVTSLCGVTTTKMLNYGKCKHACLIEYPGLGACLIIVIAAGILGYHQ